MAGLTTTSRVVIVATIVPALMTSAAAVAAVSAVLTGRAGLELLVLFLDIGNEVYAKLLGLVNHAIIRTTTGVSKTMGLEKSLINLRD